MMNKCIGKTPQLMLCQFLLCLLPSVAGWTAPAVVHSRTAAGKWETVPASEQAGKITVHLSPHQLGSGETTVVIGKPQWMTLADDEPPHLAWLELNGNRIQAVNGDIGIISQFPASLRLGLADNANPVAPAVQVLQQDGLPFPAAVRSEVGPPDKSGRLTLTVPVMPPGEYDLRVRVQDLSPQANATEIPLRFRVIGFHVDDDQQSIRIGTPGGGFTFEARVRAELQIGNARSPAYLSTGIAGGYLYIDRIERVETLQDSPDVHSIRIFAIPGEMDNKQDGSKFARLQYDLTVRRDLPCLLVTSRTINLGPKQDIYSWWGWLPGSAWHDASGEHTWAGKYQDVGKVDWVFLPQTDSRTPGIGWLSPHRFGESRFSTMLLYTEPTHIPTETDGSVEIRFALMQAASPAEVAAVSDKIKELNIW